MLIVLVGGSKKEVEKETKSASGRSMHTVRFDDSNFSIVAFESYLTGTGLFGEHYCVILDRVLTLKDAQDFLLENSSALVTSKNTFVVCEAVLSAEHEGRFTKSGAVVRIEKEKKEKLPEKINIFALSDALGERDRKKLWVLYQKALRVGKSPEEVSGTLTWILKSMLLVSSGADTSLSPFVRAKAARFLKKYPGEEAAKLLYRIVREYHESRRGGLSLEERLEQVILTL